MKISFIREKLVRAMGVVLRMVSTQVTLPILANIKLDCDEGRLKISATDLEVGIETWIGAKITEKGSITLPAKLFFEYLSSIDEEKIDLETKDNKIKITGQKTKTQIKGLSSSDFPLIPKIKDTIINLKIDIQKFKKAIINCSFACAQDETRPMLTGILFKITKDNYILTATDSYRLCETKIKHNQKNIKEIQTIIPKRTMNELVRIIDDIKEEAEVIIGENQISFNFGQKYFISRLIEGSFPEYEQIIPKKFITTLVVNKNDFVNRLKIASLFSRDSANNIKIEVSKDKNILSISSYSQQVGDNESQLDIKNLIGENINFSVNAGYILDVLNIIKKEQITIKILNKESPIFISDDEKSNFFCIIMPLRQDK